MVIKLFLIGCLLVSHIIGAGQTASEVLRHGKKIGKDDFLFVSYFNGQLWYDIREDNKSFKWHVFKEKEIFLSKEETISILWVPENPLKYSSINTFGLIPNGIDTAAAAVLRNISNLLSSSMAGALAGIVSCPKTGNINKHITDITDLLKDDRKAKINVAFNSLEKLNFSTNAVEAALHTIDTGQIKAIKEHFNNVETKLTELKTEIVGYDDDETVGCMVKIVAQHVYSQIHNDLKDVLKNQQNRLANLLKCYTLLQETIDKAKSSRSGFTWIIDLNPPTLTEGNNISDTISIVSPEIALNSEGEIAFGKEKTILKRVFVIKEFRRFIPEVSAGIAYTNIAFKKYGVAKNDNGEEVVSETGEDVVRKVNFTSMINWNYYCKSNIIPFVQTGIGANAGYPIFLVGGGVRVGGIPQIPAFAFSVGVASSCVKSLDKLKPGEKVKDATVVEKDVKYIFNWPLQFYVGFQLQL